MQRFLQGLGALVVTAIAGPALAATGLVNGSFEQTDLQPLDYCYLQSTCSGTVDGWDGDAPVIASGSPPWSVPSNLAGWDSAQGAVLIGLQNASYIEQTLTLDAGTYTLSWMDAGRYAYDATHYEVLLDGQVLGSYDTVGGQSWAQQTLNLVVASGGSHVLRLQGVQVSPDGTAFIDAMTLTTSVPEPSGLALGLGGLALIGGRLRRRRG